MAKRLKEIIFDNKNLGKIVIDDYFCPDFDIASEEGKKIYSQKRIYEDGSYEIYDDNGLKSEEYTSEGSIIKYDKTTGRKRIEKDKEGNEKFYRDDGKTVAYERHTDDTFISYHENNEVHCIRKTDFQLCLGADKTLHYKVEGEQVYINPDIYSYYRIGIKDANDKLQLKTAISPKKKTILFLGGDQTTAPNKALGNINLFVKSLDLSSEQMANVQLCSCYRPINSVVTMILPIQKQRQQKIADFEREFIEKFLPFIADTSGQKPQRYSLSEAKSNLRNLMIIPHCYGSCDLKDFSILLHKKMMDLGYTPKEQNDIMKEAICLTNNSQQEFTDCLDFTVFHRYSVKDGQLDPDYDLKYSCGYPLYLDECSEFSAGKGNKSAFIDINRQEILMAFDRILIGGAEHTHAFATINDDLLTEVGQKQAALIKNIGQFWYNNNDEVPSAKEIVAKCSTNKDLSLFSQKSFVVGREIAAATRNPLKNRHILKSIFNKYKAKDSDSLSQITFLDKILPPKNR